RAPKRKRHSDDDNPAEPSSKRHRGKQKSTNTPAPSSFTGNDDWLFDKESDHRHDDVECDESMPLPFLNDNDHAAQFDEHDYLYLEPEVNSFFSDDSASDSECDEPSSSDSSSTEPELNALGCTVLPGCACDRRDESYWLKIVKFGKKAIKFQHACDMQPDWM